MVNRNFDSRIQKFDKRNNIKSIIPIIPLKQNFEKLGRILVIANSSTYSSDGYAIYRYLRKISKFSWVDIELYYSPESLNLFLLKYYDLGCRCFIAPTVGEINMLNVIMPFFKSHSDAIYFDTYSTFNFDKSLFSDNMIFLAMNDQSTCEYIIDTILYEYDVLTKLDSASGLYDPISGDRSYNSNNILLPIFENVVYIYSEKYLYNLVENLSTDDMYAYGYGDELYKASLKHTPDITFTRIMIKDDNFVLPDNVKNMLLENPVSGTYFKSRKKTIFIVNSSDPEKMLSLFDEEYMYDNYFILGDTFIQSHPETKFQFNYAIAPVGAFSYEGFKLSKYISIDGEYFSPFLYSLFDIIIKFQDFWKYYIYYKFTMKEILDDLKKKEYIIYNNYWHERKIFTYQVNYKDDSNNKIYANHVFFEYKFNPLTAGTFVGLSDIDLLINDDSNDPTSISLTNFAWNSRNSVVEEFLEDIPLSLIFFNESEFDNWKISFDKSVGGDRNSSLVNGYKNHTPLYFEIWRSHDNHLNIMSVDISYDLLLDYLIPQSYNINKTITINRTCYQEAGINNDIPVDNFLYNETEDITIDFDTELINGKTFTNYIMIIYFKGNRYKKSFNGLSTDYLAPLQINININPIIIYKKYKVDDFVVSSKIIGKVIHVSNDYQEIKIQPYSTIFEENNDSHYIKIDNTKDQIICNQTNTNLYSKVSPVKLIDYTNWSVFTQNMFVRYVFMNDIINDDSNQINSMSYNSFGGDSRKDILQAIKDNISLTFSKYDYWLYWKELVNNSSNEGLHTGIFWEMLRSNKLDFIEKTIDVRLIMDNNESKSYKIYKVVEIERKIYSDFDTYESSETFILPVSFKTSDIIPNDVINKPIIYVEYFVGNEYKNSFNGVLESYLSPVLIHINILPNIIYTKYKIDDYVVYQNKFIAQVLSVSDDYTISEIQLYNIIFTDDNIIYVKANNSILNVTQNEISLFTTIGSSITQLSTDKFTLTTDMNIIKNINEVETLDKCDYIDDKTLDIVILEDTNSIYSNYLNFFKAYYNTEIVELINNYFIVFSNMNVFNNWITDINNEILTDTKHTYLFFELWRSHDILLTPINVTIDYKLLMNNLTPDKYNIVKTINLSRNIYNYDINNSLISSSNENFNVELNFNTEKILPSDVLNKPMVYVSYFKGNKYLNYNNIPTYYSPVIITINILPVNISEKIKINEFMIYNKSIYKIILIENNFEKISLQKYSILKKESNIIYIKNTQIIEIVTSNDIIPYSDMYEMKLVDQTEWGPFGMNNTVTENSVENDIILADSISVGNKTLSDFNLTNTILFEDINITTQNENIYNNFTKIINRSVTFDKLNHTSLFFEIWRSHSTSLIPLIIEINYNLQMLSTASSYLIEKNIQFTRNIYNIIGVKEDNFKITESDNLNIILNTPQITQTDILGNPLFFVKYFKGHKYITSFSNIIEPYFSPIIVKINIIPSKNNNSFELDL